MRSGNGSRSSLSGLGGFGLPFLFGTPPIALPELLYTTGGIHELLLAGEKRMTVPADFDRQLVLRAARLERVSTRTRDDTLHILGMNLLLHDSAPTVDAALPVHKRSL